jgi:hypothetical protein
MRKLVVRAVAASVVLAGAIIGAQPASATSGTATSVTAALPTCASWSVYALTSGVEEWRVATITRQGFERNCELRTGDRGPGVFVLQDTLRRCYGQNIAQDAIYGDATMRAVRNVQAFHRVTVDGVYGPVTSRAMIFARYLRDSNYFTRCWVTDGT